MGPNCIQIVEKFTKLSIVKCNKMLAISNDSKWMGLNFIICTNRKEENCTKGL